MFRLFRPTVIPALLCALAFAVATPSAALYAQGKGKPGGGSTLPPVRYRVQLWTAPGEVMEVNDTNGRLQSVGAFSVRITDQPVEFHAYLYDPTYNSGHAINLNLIVSGLRPGWRLRNATSINETGLIGAHAQRIGAPELELELQAVIIDLNQDPPTVTEIPDRGFTDFSRFADINDFGEIVATFRRSDGLSGFYVCKYDADTGTISEPQIIPSAVTPWDNHKPRINNAGEIIGTLGLEDAFRCSWNGGVIEKFSGLRPHAINENGVFCGMATVVTGKGNKNNTSQYAYLYGDSLQLFTENRFALDLNETNDFLSDDGYPRLNHRQHGILAIPDLLHPDDSLLIESKYGILCDTMSERDPDTGFPILTGRYRGLGLQLFPVAP